MGRTYRFRCTHCAYHADISGGADSGVNCNVQTIHCRDCRQLFDVFTRVRREKGSPEPIPKFPAFERPEIPPILLRDSQFVPPRPTPRQFEWKQVKLACPIADHHVVEVWKHPGHCPRCYAFMEQEGQPFRVWE